MTEVVVDASAVLALLNQETGNEEISRVIDKAAIIAVNLSEVYTKQAQKDAKKLAASNFLGLT